MLMKTGHLKNANNNLSSIVKENVFSISTKSKLGLSDRVTKSEKLDIESREDATKNILEWNNDKRRTCRRSAASSQKLF